jgi:hypothetical protein
MIVSEGTETDAHILSVCPPANKQWLNGLCPVRRLIQVFVCVIGDQSVMSKTLSSLTATALWRSGVDLDEDSSCRRPNSSPFVHLFSSFEFVDFV